MKIKDILTNYCAFTYQTPPFHSQYNQKNILCNSANLPFDVKNYFFENGCILDETGDNISNLNYTFAELTALYWIWKNSPEKVVGLTHYRRFWIEEEVNQIEYDKNTVYVVPKSFLDPNYFTDENKIIDQFIVNHGEYIIQKLKVILEKNQLSYKNKHFNILYNIRFIYFCNMFFCNKKIFDKICEILFEVLFSVYSENFLYISNLPPDQKRLIGFLSERILTTIFLNIDEFVPGSKIKEVGFKMFKIQ